MKKISLLAPLVLLFFLSCSKRESQNNTPSQQESTKKQLKTNYEKLPYIKEIESYKNQNDNITKYWSARLIHTATDEEILDLDASTDGKKLLYVSTNKTTSFIYMMDAKTATMPSLIYKDKNITWARFNHASDKIIFASFDDNIKSSLYSIDLTKNLTQIPERIEINLNGKINSTVTSSQNITAFSYEATDTKEGKLRLINKIDLKRDNITFKTFLNASSPHWSLNGNTLIFLSNVFGKNEIVKWDVNNNGIQRITTTEATIENPSLSPDQNWVIYNSNELSKNNVYIIQINTPNIKRITYMKDMEFHKPIWSNNGNIYAIGTKNKKHFLFQFSLEAKSFHFTTDNEPSPNITRLINPTQKAELEVHAEN